MSGVLLTDVLPPDSALSGVWSVHRLSSDGEVVGDDVAGSVLSSGRTTGFLQVAVSPYSLVAGSSYRIELLVKYAVSAERSVGVSNHVDISIASTPV